MSTLIVFTNKKSLKSITGIKDGKKVDPNTIFIGIDDLDETNCYFFNGQELNKKNKVEEGGIYLILDTIKDKEFNTFVKEINNKDHVFILYHLNRNGGGFNCNLDAFKRKKEGQHSSGSTNGYPQFVQKVKDLGIKKYADDDIAAIIEAIFRINAKRELALDFLHKYPIGASVTQGDLIVLCEELEIKEEKEKKVLANLFIKTVESENIDHTDDTTNLKSLCSAILYYVK